MHDIEVKILNREFYSNTDIFSSNRPELNLPKYATSGSAALDLRTTHDVILQPNQAAIVQTGLAIWINDSNICAVILPRSGLGTKQETVIGNLVGLIDSDYQGELLISLWNRGKIVREYTVGSKVAQMVFLPVLRPKLKLVSEFSDSTDRLTGGFGSTGVK